MTLISSSQPPKRPCRKRLSLFGDEDCSALGGGVFVSMKKTPPVSRECSLTSMETDTVGELSESSLITPASSWKTAGTSEHNRNTPLIVSDPEHPTEIVDEAAALGRMLERSRRLPSTGPFSSNHIMINNERLKRTIAPLIRLHELDQIAREHAQEMASRDTLLFHTPNVLHAKFHRPSRRLGENVARGESIDSIHRTMMTTSCLAHKNNILDRRYTHMGMATARGPKGNLYLCQVFRG